MTTRLVYCPGSETYPYYTLRTGRGSCWTCRRHYRIRKDGLVPRHKDSKVLREFWAEAGKVTVCQIEGCDDPTAGTVWIPADRRREIVCSVHLATEFYGGRGVLVSEILPEITEIQAKRATTDHAHQTHADPTLDTHPPTCVICGIEAPQCEQTGIINCAHGRNCDRYYAEDGRIPPTQLARPLPFNIDTGAYAEEVK